MFPPIKPISITPKYPDNVIKLEFEGGYTQKRKRHTRSKMTFEVTYFLEKTDKDLLETHYKKVETITPFDWVNPNDGKIHIVQFSSPLEVPRTGDFPKHFNIKITLEEV